MNETEVIETARQAILIAIEISLPILLVGLIVGVAIALVQALTQIQEITLVFVPKNRRHLPCTLLLPSQLHENSDSLHGKPR